MNETKHTPELWQAEPCPCPLTCCLWQVVKAYGASSVNTGRLVAAQIARTDACLIAAAPELLEAARYTVADGVVRGWCRECDAEEHKPDCTMARLQAAVAKAEGKT
jgi:hypothetical protein